MASAPLLLHKLNFPHKPTSVTPRSPHPTTAARRSILLKTLITAPISITLSESAAALDLRFTVPDQTVEEAEKSIQIHSQSLLGVKDLLKAESWVEAQKALRKSSSYLKRDLYTIIQGKSAKERPRLRKLYADLFNAVTKLDYAARDEDRIRIWDFWGSIVTSLDFILSAI